MLQAIVRRKGRKFLLDGGRRLPREDIMLDCVVGSLRYMSSRNAGLALSWIFPTHFSDRCEVDKIVLWPRRDNCEPDALIQTTEDGRSLTTLIEAKWGSNAATNRQLLRQQDVFLMPEGNAHDRLHILLLGNRKNVEEGVEALFRGRHRLITSWSDLSKGLRQRARGGPIELENWASDLLALLEVATHRRFGGWSDFAEVSAPTIPLFFEQYYAWPSLPVEHATSPIFWDRKKKGGAERGR
jgi:hypothetical protein